MTTYAKTIGIACRIQALVSHTREDYRDANDCFCRRMSDPSLYRNSHESLRYIREAVVEKLQRDGLTPHAPTLTELDAELQP